MAGKNTSSSVPGLPPTPALPAPPPPTSSASELATDLHSEVLFKMLFLGSLATPSSPQLGSPRSVGGADMGSPNDSPGAHAWLICAIAFSCSLTYKEGFDRWWADVQPNVHATAIYVMDLVSLRQKVPRADGKRGGPRSDRPNDGRIGTHRTR